MSERLTIKLSISIPKDLCARLAGCRDKGVQLPLPVINKQAATGAALINMACRCAEYATNRNVSRVCIGVSCNRVVNDLVNGVKRRKPLLVGDQVCFVRQIVGLVSDSRTTLATNLHKG